MAKYHKPEAGEWFYPVMKGWRHGCCDCGLVHTIDLRIDNVRFKYERKARPAVALRFSRNEQATAGKRSAKRFKRIKKAVKKEFY